MPSLPFSNTATLEAEGCGEVGHNVSREMKTPKAFIAACDKFINLEILRHASIEETKTEASLAAKSTQRPADNRSRIDKATIQLMVDSVEDLADDNGWTFLGDLGNLLLKKRPDFHSETMDTPNYCPSSNPSTSLK